LHIPIHAVRARAMLMGDHRISNAKAKRELLWTPSAPTYREGISRLVQALGEACIEP
jgi:hypothetical protein